MPYHCSIVAGAAHSLAPAGMRLHMASLTLRDGDLLVTIGAGDVVELAEALVEEPA